MLDRFHKISEIVASFAIVGSLLFVGVQIAQSTTATYLQAHQVWVQDETHTAELLIVHPDVAALVLIGEEDPEQLSDADRMRFYQFAMRRFATWEAVQLNYGNGLVGHGEWEGWNHYFTSALNRPGYKIFWEENRLSYFPDIRRHIETILFPS